VSSPGPGSSPPPLRGEGERRRWTDLPEPVRAVLEGHLGARVVEAISERGGFSPGVASRLRLSDGRRVFAKIVSREANPDSPELHRREAEVLRQLPDGLPVPRLLSLFDDGTWAALFLEEIPGRSPRLPWDPHDLHRVLSAHERLEGRLTPSPFPAPSFLDRHAPILTAWREYAAGSRAGDTVPPDIDPWFRGRLDRLVELEERLPCALQGESLLHCDLRADNVLLTDDAVYFADWPHACRGPAWADVVLFLPSVALQGGPGPAVAFEESGLGRSADPEDVNALLAAVAGFWVRSGRRPAAPGLAPVRPFQRAQGDAALRWLRDRLERP